MCCGLEEERTRLGNKKKEKKTHSGQKWVGRDKRVRHVITLRNIFGSVYCTIPVSDIKTLEHRIAFFALIRFKYSTLTHQIRSPDGVVSLKFSPVFGTKLGEGQIQRSDLLPNLQRGGACHNFAYYSMLIILSWRPKGGRPWPNVHPLNTPLLTTYQIGYAMTYWRILYCRLHWTNSATLKCKRCTDTIGQLHTGRVCGKAIVCASALSLRVWWLFPTNLFHLHFICMPLFHLLFFFSSYLFIGKLYFTGNF